MIDRDFCLAYYIGDRKTGTISIVHQKAGVLHSKMIPQGDISGLDDTRRPVFIGLTEDRSVILFDPVSKSIAIRQDLPADAFPAHIYRDRDRSVAWFMNDGDKKTGNDSLNCGEQGSSVTVIDAVASAEARYLATICVGRGHHQAAFSAPTAKMPATPARAYISNLKDGSLSVIANDPGEAEHYLKVVATIDLIEPDKEPESLAPGSGNNAFPHGIAFSSETGLIYNLNNGYGTIAVIDPVSNTIIERIPFKGHSNLFVTPCGRFLIGRGADRKSDPDHVVARLSVLDVASQQIISHIELTDIYISKYYFSPDGHRLYLTTSASGSPEQKANCKDDALLVFDLTALPELRLINELRLGVPSGTLDFQCLADDPLRIFSSLAPSGEIAIIEGDGVSGVKRLEVAVGGPHSRLWLIEN